MAVYAEYLFLENFITGLLLLYFTARFTGNMPQGKNAASFRRILAGGVLSGLGAFLLFLPMNMAAALTTRAAAALLICLAGLGRQNLLRKTAVFLILSLLSGGGAMALFFWRHIPALAGNGVIYMEAMTYTALICCGVPAMVLTGWFIGLVRKQRRTEMMSGVVELELAGIVCRLPAYVDSANGLKDPVSGKPAILIDDKGSRKLPFQKESCRDRFVVVPYRTVGTEAGLLTGIRLDKIRFRGKETYGTVLAFYEGRFEGFDVLLNREILEGGVLEHAESVCGEYENPGAEILPGTEQPAEKKASGRSVLHRRK